MKRIPSRLLLNSFDDLPDAIRASRRIDTTAFEGLKVITSLYVPQGHAVLTDQYGQIMWAGKIRQDTQTEETEE